MLLLDDSIREVQYRVQGQEIRCHVCTAAL